MTKTLEILIYGLLNADGQLFMILTNHSEKVPKLKL